MFAKVLREFRTGCDDLLRMPLKRFWFLLAQVERLRSEENLRTIGVLASATSPEGYKNAVEFYEKEVGEIYVWVKNTSSEFRIDPDTGLDPEFDRGALHALKARLVVEKTS